MIPVREYIRENKVSAHDGVLEKAKTNSISMRPLRNSDFTQSDAESNANRGVVTVDTLD